MTGGDARIIISEWSHDALHLDIHQDSDDNYQTRIFVAEGSQIWT